jgi:hypothetical protein
MSADVHGGVLQAVLGLTGRATARRVPLPLEGERYVKIKVKKVERIEATRPHVDPDPPQGSV